MPPPHPWVPCSQDETPTAAAAAARSRIFHIHEDFKGEAPYSHRSSRRFAVISRARQLQQEQEGAPIAVWKPDWLASTGVSSTRDWVWGSSLPLHTVRQHTTAVYSSS